MPDHKRITNDLTNPSIEERLNGEYEVHGFKMQIEVSPCSWMYEGYGLQVQYGKCGEGHSWGFCNRKNLPAKDATREDVQAMLDEQTVLHECEDCKQEHLKSQNPGHPGNRGDKCEACFIGIMNEKFAAIKAEQEAEDAAEDAKHKAKGYKYRTVAWVHPSGGGDDDYQIEWYSVKKPTKAEVQAELRRKRSNELDDYTIIKL